MDTIVHALEDLLESTETKDIIKSLFIAQTEEVSSDHCKIFLTSKGLLEKGYCAGHDTSNISDEHYTEYCGMYKYQKRIMKKDYGKIVKKYKLTTKKITEKYAKIREKN